MAVAVAIAASEGDGRSVLLISRGSGGGNVREVESAWL